MGTDDGIPRGLQFRVVSHRRGYGTFLALISCGQRLTIGSLLCINMLAVLLAIVLTGAAAARMALTDDVTLRARTATLAMIFTEAYVISSPRGRYSSKRRYMPAHNGRRPVYILRKEP